MTGGAKDILIEAMKWGLFVSLSCGWSSHLMAASQGAWEGRLSGILAQAQPENLDPLGILGEDNSNANALPMDDELSLDDPKQKPKSGSQKKAQESSQEQVSSKKPEQLAPAEEKQLAPLEQVQVPPVEIAAPLDVPAPVERAAPPAPEVSPQMTTSAGTYSRRDKPNLKTEKKFFNIYKKFNALPTNVEAWDQVVGTRSSEAYKVQKGDTLWDLSQTFFGDPNYWPKIWSINKDEVLNPHQVNPNMTIRFFPGSVSEAPTLGILTNEKVNEPYQEPQSLAVVNPAQSNEFVRGSQVPDVRPVGKIPSSLPIYRMGQVHKAPIKYEMQSLPIDEGLRESPIQYMMLDEPPKPVGWVAETEFGTRSAGDFQYIFVELADGSPRILTVFKEKERFGGGSLLEIQGEIQVIDRVSERRNLYRALVRKAVNMVQVGSDLREGPMQRFSLLDGQTLKPSAPVKILSGIYGDRISVYGLNSYVFMNSGSAQGIEIGRTLPIYKNQSIRVRYTGIETLPDQIGKVKVISVGKNFSTGIVTASTDVIRRGDWAGIPGVRLSNQPVPERELVRKEAEVDLNSDFNEALEKTFGSEESEIKKNPPTESEKVQPEEGLQL
jgi:hypothetical protein